MATVEKSIVRILGLQRQKYIYIAACSNYGAKPIVAILAYLNF